MAGGKVIEVNDQQFEQEVLNSDIPVIVDFWAPWCGPCNQFAPTFENLSVDYEGKVKFVKVNVDESQQYAANYGVMSIPTLLIFKNGQIQGEPMMGVQSVDVINQRLNEVL
ncbi:thioredoxin [Candidatus Absconditicoccus praedator]|uniref:thioredoxin n=1 Tax=Candidatus Absconditicoccus praedator TaxID=2735562 RepID=UPI001E2DFE35|nr:thioredoxin [Candidatus Absconditicoccus praedator]UFX82651.1 thioredoxin [Candidatus Absconditicoccus praedator]